MAKRGKRLCRSSRRWHLAAALRRRCRAQSTHEANQLDGGRIDHVDGALETTRQPASLSSVSKARLQVLQVREHAPEQLFGHDRIAMFARIGLPVAVQRGCPNNPNQPAMVTQRIAHIIESDCVGELGAAYRHRLAPCAESAHLGINLRFHARV